MELKWTFLQKYFYLKKNQQQQYLDILEKYLLQGFRNSTKLYK